MAAVVRGLVGCRVWCGDAGSLSWTERYGLETTENYGREGKLLLCIGTI